MFKPNYKTCQHNDCYFEAALGVGSEYYCVLHYDKALKAHTRFINIVKSICKTVNKESK